MATPAEHRSKALKNERLIQTASLAEGEFVDWAVTALFYAALHWVRALSAQEGFQIRDYAMERIALESVPTFQLAPKHMKLYRTLKDESRDARYEMKSFTALDYQDLEANYYAPFRTFILSHLRS